MQNINNIPNIARNIDLYFAEKLNLNPSGWEKNIPHPSVHIDHKPPNAYSTWVMTNTSFDTVEKSREGH